MSVRHLLSIDDLDDAELHGLVERGTARGARDAECARPLAGRVVGVLFRKTSTRTRTAFASGAIRLGAGVVSYGPNDLQENTGESVEDTGRVLSRMLDALVARTAGPQHDLHVLARQPHMAVVNAMSEDEHPTQALADLSTILSFRGCIEGVCALYVGEGNNTATALTRAFARVPGAVLDLRTPPGYGVGDAALSAARAASMRTGATVRERHDLDDLASDVDIVYTTRWQTTGTTKHDPGWRTTFAPFRVGSDLMARYPRAHFMHDLPAHRGEEVDAAVLDGPASVAFEQAQHKLYSAMAILEWCLAEKER